MSVRARNAEETADAPGELAFSSLDEFVREYLSQVVHRRLNRAVQLWCPEWWRHPEAVARLSVLWRAFEFLRQDPALGLSTWWLHHADPHLRALMHPQYGPFVACDPRDGHGDMQPRGLPATRAPEEFMAHPAFALQPEDLEAVADGLSAAARPDPTEYAAYGAVDLDGEDDHDAGGKRKTKEKDPGRDQGK
ncbi:MAG TPA: DUF4913 domain-containing protein [Yinghuangia sp.]|uniref:DUF4913 domain-containing protein n=1 Tax=Yinghuangia sp. YIM S10712 TaxID=3436930 RepID=UPI002C33F29C|nr:DUF4913 domain-containing protein [Yinghuangia sp.]